MKYLHFTIDLIKVKVELMFIIEHHNLFNTYIIKWMNSIAISSPMKLIMKKTFRQNKLLKNNFTKILLVMECKILLQKYIKI